MNRLILQPTSTAQWHALVNDAAKHCGEQLAEELESYLVFLLQRFADKPELAGSVLAIDYLEGCEAGGCQRVALLRDVGDTSLLFSGLFPDNAEKRHVPVSYFVEIGQSAYNSLSTLEHPDASLADLFDALCQRFVSLMDLLQCMRELGGEEFGLTPLQAEELWRRTGSNRAREVLRRFTAGLPIADDAGFDPRSPH